VLVTGKPTSKKLQSNQFTPRNKTPTFLFDQSASRVRRERGERKVVKGAEIKGPGERAGTVLTGSKTKKVRSRAEGEGGQNAPQRRGPYKNLKASWGEYAFLVPGGDGKKKKGAGCGGQAKGPAEKTTTGQRNRGEFHNFN